MYKKENNNENRDEKNDDGAAAEFAELETISDMIDAETETEKIETPRLCNKRPDIDDITLQCFMNKSKYNKFLSRTDPEKYERRREFDEKRTVYRDEILEYTEMLLRDIDSAHNSDIQTSFNEYVKCLVEHLEYQSAIAEDKDSAPPRDKYEHEYMDTAASQPRRKPQSYVPRLDASSFWGGKIHKK